MIDATEFLLQYANADVGPFAGGYSGKVLGTQAANLIGYWPLWETSGTNADNLEGTAARDGTYTGVTLNSTTGPDGTPAGLWDGANDYCDIFSASLETALSISEGTMMTWVKVSGSGVWTDGDTRHLLRLFANGSNEINIRKNAANSELFYNYRANGANHSITQGSVSETGWFHIGMTWSQSSGDKMVAYYNGSQTGSDVTPLQAFGAGIATAWLGQHSIGTGEWDGYLAHCAIWDTPLSSAQMLALATV